MYITRILRIDIINKTKDRSKEVNIEDEKNIINNGLLEVNEIMDSFQFSQKSIHITLWSLIMYAILTTLFMLGIIICVCRPDRVIICKNVVVDLHTKNHKDSKEH